METSTTTRSESPGVHVTCEGISDVAPDCADSSEVFDSFAPALRSPAERLMSPLTPRELEAVRLMCDGWSNEEISKLTGVSLSTIKYHFFNAFGKLGVRRRTQAVAVAIHLGLVRPDWLMGKRLDIGEHTRTTTRLRPKYRTA